MPFSAPTSPPRGRGDDDEGTTTTTKGVVRFSDDDDDGDEDGGDGGGRPETLLHGTLLRSRAKNLYSRRVLKNPWRHVVLNLRTGELSVHAYDDGSGEGGDEKKNGSKSKKKSSSSSAAAQISKSNRTKTEIVQLPRSSEGRATALDLLGLSGSAAGSVLSELYGGGDDGTSGGGGGGGGGGGSVVEYRLPRGTWSVLPRPDRDDKFVVLYDLREYLAAHRGYGNESVCMGRRLSHTASLDMEESQDLTGVDLATSRSFSSDEEEGAASERTAASGKTVTPYHKWDHTKPKVKGKIYLKCPGGGNEKSMWIKATESIIGGESTEPTTVGSRSLESDARGNKPPQAPAPTLADKVKEKIKAQKNAVTSTNWRYRKGSFTAVGARNVSVALRVLKDDNAAVKNRSLDLPLTDIEPGSFNDSFFLDSSLDGSSGGGAPEGDKRVKEYRVQPSYAYPNQWMTEHELQEELLRPSSRYQTFGGGGEEPPPRAGKYDRSPPPSRGGPTTAAKLPQAGTPVVGSLHVEVLSCEGLPRNEALLPDQLAGVAGNVVGKKSLSSVAYLVCGPNAFHTDVLTGTNNPRWLRRSKRAATFPLSHPYASLYAGVFDPSVDPSVPSKGFAGRVAVDCAVLRPGCLYDVTLPLRCHAHMYTRRPRGTIRLRLRLEWDDERAAVLSYLPPNVRADPVTIVCGDRAAFRYIALTVHGMDMHGKWSRTIMTATSREFKLYKKHTFALARKTVKDLRNWERPSLSAFVFAGWMHCVYRSSVDLIPSYFFGYVALNLVRNYARFVVSSNVHGGYAPITVREIVAALLGWRSGKKKSTGGDRRRGGSSRKRREEHHLTKDIRPLAVKRRSQSDPPPRPQLESSVSILSMLGMWDDDDDVCTFKNMGRADHLEFPFSDGDRHPKLTLEESFAANPNQSLPKEAVEDSRHRAPPSTISKSRGLDAFSVDDDFPEALCVAPGAQCSVTAAKCLDEGAMAAPAPPIEHIAPDQNMDVFVKKKSILEDLDEFREKAQKHTFHLIQDSVAKARRLDGAPLMNCDTGEMYSTARRTSGSDEFYANVSALSFDMGSATDTERDMVRMLDEEEMDGAEEEEDNLHAHVVALERSLGIGVQRNPILAVQEKYANRAVKVLRIGLLSYRSVFNLFTWRDPYATFWFLAGCVALALLNAVLPWRWFFLAAGVAFVGPQNFVLCRLRKWWRETRWGKAGKEGEASAATAAAALDDNSPSAAGGDFSRKDSSSTTTSQPTSIGAAQADEQQQQPPPHDCIAPFHSHGNSGGKSVWAGKKGEPVLSEVIVPYSPLRQERFYDWPPEPTHSKVTCAETDAASAVNCGGGACKVR